jgi:hypothetical protein
VCVAASLYVGNDVLFRYVFSLAIHSDHVVAMA